MPANIAIQTTGGSDVITFAGSVLDTAVGAKFLASTITITAANGDKIVFKGAFTYTGVPTLSPLNLPIAGNVTSIVMTQGAAGSAYGLINGIDVSVADVIAAFVAEDSGMLFDAVADIIRFTGNSGADVFTGHVLNDIILGGGGGDNLGGGGGDDIVEGGAGADILNGGIGKDTLSYENSSAKVTVNLAALTATGGDATGDTISGFENVAGSDFNDRLFGNDKANVLTGGIGNDVLRGGAGADTLSGAGGSDTADYTGSTAGVTINLATGTATGGHAQGDTLSLINNITGSGKDDVLTGSNQMNVLKGAAGVDTLDGGVAADTLDGGSGNDRLIGGQATDTLFGRGGADTFVLDNVSLNADTIKDFEVGVDTIEISASLFGGGLTAGALVQLEQNTSGAATAPGTRFILDTDDGHLYFDINGSGGGTTGLRLVAVLEGNLTGFSASDFEIVA